jgi:hypothetical protein
VLYFPPQNTHILNRLKRCAAGSAIAESWC